MEKHKRNLDESVNMHNCYISILTDMMKQPFKPYIEFVKGINISKIENERIARSIRNSVVNNLVKEILVIVNEMWKLNPGRFDESLIVQKNTFNMIKNKMSKDGKPLPFNTRELYKRVRQAISHNSETIENCVFNLDNFELNLGKVNGDDYIIELSVEELYTLIHVLILNRQMNPTNYISYNDVKIETKLDIKNSVLIGDHNQANTKQLDDYQIDRVYNYFKNLTNKDNIKDEQSNIIKFLPLPENPESLLSQKTKALIFVSMFDVNTNCAEAINNCNSIKENVDLLNVYFAIVSNLMFEIASSRTNQELIQLFGGCGVKDEDIPHLRNALCHGRYFHNFNDKFYFYDGRRELEYKLTITVNQFNKLMDKIAMGEKSIIVK